MAVSRDDKISLHQWEQAKEIFEIAVELESHARDRYLVDACANNLALFDEVRELLDYHDRASSFLQEPPAQSAEHLARPVFSTGEFVAGRFRIMRLIGHGGMGEVYVAYDVELGELIALKTLRPGLLADARMISFFKQEVHLARLVTHRNVCRIFDIFWHQGRGGDEVAVLTMEYLPGETLLERIRACGPFSSSEALPIVRQIGDGLDAAHRFAIVHGDFKSSNVMLVPQPDDTTRVVIMDFGLARDQHSAPGRLDESQVAGTPAYIAPEQLRGNPLTVASDIYAFGVVLFEMLTGRLPFQGGQGTLITLKGQQPEPPSPRDYAEKLELAWESTVLKCLDCDPNKRPSSAAAIPGLLTRKVAWSLQRRLAIATISLVILIGIFLERPHVINSEAEAAVDGARVALENDSKEGFAKAIEDYRRAIQADPKWAQPWAELAYTYAAASNARYIEGKSALRQAREAALQAIALDPSLAKAHGALAWTQSLDFDEWPKAEESFRRALELSPNDAQIRYWFGVHLRKKGRFKEAEEQDRRALNLTHRRDPNVWCELAFLYWTSNQIPKLKQHMEEQLKTYPNFAYGRYLNARLLKIEKRFDQAEEELSFAEKLGVNPVTAMVERASLEEYRGDFFKARYYVAKLEEAAHRQEIDGLLLAGIYVGLHDYDAAFATLEEAYQRRDNTLLSLATSPVVQPLRGDPRYQSLLNRLHFSDQIMQQMEFNSSSPSGELRHRNRTGTS